MICEEVIKAYKKSPCSQHGLLESGAYINYKINLTTRAIKMKSKLTKLLVMMYGAKAFYDIAIDNAGWWEIVVICTTYFYLQVTCSFDGYEAWKKEKGYTR